jgi:GT2 family glycosyltransferase
MLPENKYASGGILAAKKEILNRLGGFPGKIGMNHARVSYGEETYLQIQMRKAGCRIGFVPDVQVQHLVPAHKQHLGWFFRAAFARGRDFWNSHDRRPNGWTLIGIAVSAMMLLLQSMTAYSRRLGRLNYFLQNWLIDVFCPLTWDLGRIAGGIKCLVRKGQHVS